MFSLGFSRVGTWFCKVTSGVWSFWAFLGIIFRKSWGWERSPRGGWEGLRRSADPSGLFSLFLYLGHLKPSKTLFFGKPKKKRFLEVKTFVFHGFGCPRFRHKTPQSGKTLRTSRFGNLWKGLKPPTRDMDKKRGAVFFFSQKARLFDRTYAEVLDVFVWKVEIPWVCNDQGHPFYLRKTKVFTSKNLFFRYQKQGFLMVNRVP